MWETFSYLFPVSCVRLPDSVPKQGGPACHTIVIGWPKTNPFSHISFQRKGTTSRCNTDPSSKISIPKVQLRTIKVIKFDNLRTRIFIEILTSDSEPETSKASRNGVALIFPRFFGCAKFLGVFNAPKSLPNQPSLHQFCAMQDPDVVDVWQNESGSNYIFFRETLTWKG